MKNIGGLVIKKSRTRLRCREDDGVRLHEPDRVAEQLWRVDWRREGLPYCGVYVISTDSLNPCKIGVSINAEKRLASLQTSHWRQLQVSEYRWCNTVDQAFRIEREAHQILKSNGKALLGEWFDVRPSDAIQAMEWAALTHNIELHSGIPDDAGVRSWLENVAVEVKYSAHNIAMEAIHGKR